MKKQLRGITALILTAAMLALSGGCFKISVTMPELTTRASVQAGESASEQIFEQQTTLPVQQQEASANQTTAPVQSTSEPVQSTLPQPSENPDEAEANPLAMSSEELLRYFNACVNKIKSEKAGFTKSKLTSILDLQLSNSAANSLVGIVKGALLSETEDITQVKKGEDSNAVMSPSNKNYVSELGLSDIAGISAVQQGDAYVITVNIKGESNPSPDGSAYSRVFDYITVDDVVSTYAPKVGAEVKRENIEVVFSDCRAIATVDAQGRVSAYETYVKGEINMYDASVKKIITINTDVSVLLGSSTKYSGFSY